jgi:hypothetical protein
MCEVAKPLAIDRNLAGGINVSAEIGASPLRTRLRTVLESFQLTRLKPYFEPSDLGLACTCL